MKFARLKRSRRRLLGLMVSVAALLAGSVTTGITPAAATLPPTPLREATMADMTSSFYPMDFLWWAAQDPNGKAKILVTITANNLPAPMLAINLTEPDGTYSNLLDIASAPFTTTKGDSPTVHSRQLDFRETADGYRLIVNHFGLEADLLFTENRPGAAMTPLNWDGQLVFWAASIGTASVSGSIKFPGDTAATPVDDWEGEEERMAGYFQLGPGHIGYDYGQSGNPDGSADQMFTFPGLDGSSRGLLAHTPPPGSSDPVTFCADPTVVYSDEQTISGFGGQQFAYPGTISASCSSPNPLSLTYTVTTPNFFPLNTVASTMSDGHSQVAGSIATIQHLRNMGTGYIGVYPGLPTTLPGLIR